MSARSEDSTEPARKVVLAGHPNIGKSVVFSRLTGTRVISANYPGTTVDFSEGFVTLDGRKNVIIDAPGTYSLTSCSRAEEVAVRLCKDADLVVNVVDATNLERCLFFTLELLESGKPLVVALNMWDEAAHKGISIDVRKLEDILGVPVIPTVALTGEGISDLVARLKDARTGNVLGPGSDDAKWVAVGKIVKDAQVRAHKHHTLKDVLSEATIRPIAGMPIAVVILAAALSLVRLIGEGFIRYISDPLFELYRPLVDGLAGVLGPGIIRDILVGKLIDGNIDFAESLGVLSTGVFVPFGMVLPYVIAFYLVLAVLEDSGYLPRLATLMDNLFHRLGMHGHGVVPVCLGLGCNVAGILAARAMESPKQRIIASTLVAISVPCMAQTAMIFGLLGKHGIEYVLIVFLTLFVVFITAGVGLKLALKGESQELFMEIPPYRRPSVTAVLQKTWMRLKWFFLDAVPWVFGGVVLINVLYATGILDAVAVAMKPVMTGWLGLPGKAATAVLAGFLRKDLAVGMLLPLEGAEGMTAEQLVVATVVLSLCFPCIATFAILLKELGLRNTALVSALMIAIAVGVGSLLRIMLGIPAMP